MPKPHAWTREPYKSRRSVIKALHGHFKTGSAIHKPTHTPSTKKIWSVLSVIRPVTNFLTCFQTSWSLLMFFHTFIVITGFHLGMSPPAGDWLSLEEPASLSSVDWRGWIWTTIASISSKQRVRLGQGGAGEPGIAVVVPIVPGMGFMAPAFQFVMRILSSVQIRYNATPAI